MSDQQQRVPGNGEAAPNGHAQPTEIETKEPELSESPPEPSPPEAKPAETSPASDTSAHGKPDEAAKPPAAPSNGETPSAEEKRAENTVTAETAPTITETKSEPAAAAEDKSPQAQAKAYVASMVEPATEAKKETPEAKAPEAKPKTPVASSAEPAREAKKEPPQAKASEAKPKAPVASSAEPAKEAKSETPEAKAPETKPKAPVASTAEAVTETKTDTPDDAKEPETRTAEPQPSVSKPAKAKKKKKASNGKAAKEKAPASKVAEFKAPEPEPAKPAPAPAEPVSAKDTAAQDKQAAEQKPAESAPADDEEEAAPSYKINDPQELARNMIRLFEEGSRLFSTMSEKTEANPSGPYTAASEIGEASKVLGAVATQWLREPGKLVEAQGKLASAYVDLWGRSVRRFLGEEDVEPVAKPDPADARFRDPDWSASPYFDFWKQAYLLTANWADEMVEKTEGLDPKTKHRAEFYLHQIESALSPSNFVFFNPEVVRETLGSNGENLVQGLKHLSEDLQQSDDVLKISQTDLDAFEVGENLAVTPGKVVFQNDIIQLIQYTPTTEKAHATPLLVVPPWINKFYILDLVPKKSFIKWVVDQGFTLFVISWVNPDKRLAEKTFEDYMHEGILAATDAACKATGEKQVNTLGYCVGGTLLATTLAWLAAKEDERIKSATFLTAQVDFSKAGDLMVFIDDAQLTALEEMMSEEGYLDGARMAQVFNMLRPKDLIWPYVVNNYLLGKKPFPFDLLFWNSDSTRLPAANHGFYLREFYKDNKLAKGELKVSGETLDLSKVTVPIYELATREDHIAPAASVYIGARMFGGPVRYVLAGSGHIAGVVNPPEKQKYQHWTGKKPSSKKHNLETLDDWLEKADEHPGSWWPDWSEWLAKQSGEKVEARVPGSGKLKAIEDAPGSYVKVRLTDGDKNGSG